MDIDSIEEIHVRIIKNTVEYRLYSNNSVLVFSRAVTDVTDIRVGSVQKYSRLRIVEIISSIDAILDVRYLIKSTDKRSIQVILFAQSILC